MIHADDFNGSIDGLADQTVLLLYSSIWVFARPRDRLQSGCRGAELSGQFIHVDWVGSERETKDAKVGEEGDGGYQGLKKGTK